MTTRTRVFAVGVVAVAIAGILALTETVWDGHSEIPLDFLILDSSTEEPIGDASIRLLLEDMPDSEANPRCEAKTGPDGWARIVHEFMTSGRSSMFRHTRTVNYSLMLNVRASGHRELKVELRDLTRDPGYHSEPVPPPIVIRLARTTTAPGGAESLSPANAR